MENITTTDLADFGSREIALLVEILNAWLDQGLPEEFLDEEVRPMFNKNSGEVFLTNSEYQVAMMADDKLEEWFHCPNCGHEGFKEDCQLTQEGYCKECTGEE